MATEVKLPRLGQGMDEGKILQWLKAEGDTIEKGDELYEVETEKVNVEVEAPAGGTILKILAGEGETVGIGTTIAWIGEKGEDVPDVASGPESASASNGPSVAPAGATASIPPAAPAATASPAPDAAPAPSVASHETASAPSSSGRVKASPLARRMAEEQGVDLGSVSGSGPDGRIIARDLEGVAGGSSAAPTSTASGAGVERIELTSMRRTIARRLGEAWQAPAFYLTRDIDMTQAVDLRERLLKGVQEGEVRPTVSDVVTKVCAVALRRHKDMNVHFAGDAILRFDAVHVGMAVATDAGLVVPVIRDAHAKTIREIATDRKALVDKARVGKLQPVDFEGGTFTISNLGMMGIDEFTAVLNPPMAGILAVGRTADRAVVVDGEIVIRPIMTITLGCDHRAVDGAVGARFLQTVAEHLEEPATML